MPWKHVDHPAAAKVMKAALEQGANFWNGVRTFFTIFFFVVTHRQTTAKYNRF